MKELTHEECSIRLEAYVSDRLDQTARREIDAHLAGCPDCSLELVALRALQAVQVEPMTGPERERVSSAVRAALAAPERRGFLERFGSRFAPALGAVALVVIAAVALVSLPNDPPDTPSSSSGEGGADEAVEDAQTMESQAEGPAPAALPDQGERDSARGDGGGTTTGGESAEAAGQPASASAQALNARSNFTVVDESFAATGLEPRSLVPARIPRRGLDYFDAGPAELAAFAPNERVGALIEECAERAIATSPHPVVPSSGAYYSDDVLVIGFVWLDPSTSTFNYELRGWIGGDCGRISPIYRRGVLE